jgi:hypothetical protein
MLKDWLMLYVFLAWFTATLIAEGYILGCDWFELKGAFGMVCWVWAQILLVSVFVLGLAILGRMDDNRT